MFLISRVSNLRFPSVIRARASERMNTRAEHMAGMADQLSALVGKDGQKSW